VTKESERASAVYRIRVNGVLDHKWSDWFNGVTITCESASDGSPVTTLTGVADQSRLRGILSKVWDLNLTVVSVTQVDEPDPTGFGNL
jgi:hypothetical protein